VVLASISTELANQAGLIAQMVLEEPQFYLLLARLARF
jgi:hypothetical protein